MASVCENDDRKAAQGGHRAFPLYYPENASILHRIPFGKMCDNKYDQVADRNQCDDAGIFQRIQAAQERQWNNYKPVSDSQPKMLQAKSHCRGTYIKPVTQNLRSTRKPILAALSLNP